MLHFNYLIFILNTTNCFMLWKLIRSENRRHNVLYHQFMYVIQHYSRFWQEGYQLKIVLTVIVKNICTVVREMSPLCCSLRRDYWWRFLDAFLEHGRLNLRYEYNNESIKTLNREAYLDSFPMYFLTKFDPLAVFNFTIYVLPIFNISFQFYPSSKAI